MFNISNDFLQVDGLKRYDFQNLWHPNQDFLSALETAGIQAYILEGTVYGCFVKKDINSKISVKWFGHHISFGNNNSGKIVPNSTMELYKILEVCEPEKVVGLIFNLDILS